VWSSRSQRDHPEKEDMFVYILYSRSLDKYYVGQTQDLSARIEKHNKGFVSSTKTGTPWVIVFTQEVKNRSEAVILERKIKGRGAKRYLQDIGM
jgi:putative endonuclease